LDLHAFSLRKASIYSVAGLMPISLSARSELPLQQWVVGDGLLRIPQIRQIKICRRTGVLMTKWLGSALLRMLYARQKVGHGIAAERQHSQSHVRLCNCSSGLSASRGYKRIHLLQYPSGRYVSAMCWLSNNMPQRMEKSALVRSFGEYNVPVSAFWAMCRLYPVPYAQRLVAYMRVYPHAVVLPHPWFARRCSAIYLAGSRVLEAVMRGELLPRARPHLLPL
jgi:hypothetical protein